VKGLETQAHIEITRTAEPSPAQRLAWAKLMRILLGDKHSNAVQGCNLERPQEQDRAGHAGTQENAPSGRSLGLV